MWTRNEFEEDSSQQQTREQGIRIDGNRVYTGQRITTEQHLTKSEQNITGNLSSDESGEYDYEEEIDDVFNDEVKDKITEIVVKGSFEEEDVKEQKTRVSTFTRGEEQQRSEEQRALTGPGFPLPITHDVSREEESEAEPSAKVGFGQSISGEKQNEIDLPEYKHKEPMPEPQPQDPNVIVVSDDSEGYSDTEADQVKASRGERNKLTILESSPVGKKAALLQEASPAEMNTNGILIPSDIIAKKIEDPNYNPTLADINRIEITPEMEALLAAKRQQREAEEQRRRHENFENLLQADLQLFEIPGDSNKYSMPQITQALLDSYHDNPQQYPIAIPSKYYLAPDPLAEDAAQKHDSQCKEEYHKEVRNKRVKWEIVLRTKTKRFVRVNKEGKELNDKLTKKLDLAAQNALELEKKNKALQELANTTAYNYRKYLSELQKEKFELKQMIATLKAERAKLVNQDAESMTEINKAFSDLAKIHDAAEREKMFSGSGEDL